MRSSAKKPQQKIEPRVAGSNESERKWKMEKRTNSSSKSGSSGSSNLREFSPDLGFHDDLSSPTGSITDFQDEWEKIEGSRFFPEKFE